MKTAMFKLFSIALLASMILAACAPAATPTQAPQPTKPAASTAAPTVAPSAAPTKPAATAAPTSKYKEAPALAEQVKAGKLPVVDQRLPANPLVYKGASVGTYGGNWRMVMRGLDYNQIFKTFGLENLLTWSPDGKDVVPNLAEKYESSADGTEFTFYLRKGLKWSDGQPYTANDIEFWWNEVAYNKDIYPTGMEVIMSGGEMGKFTKVDDYTFKLKFKAPYVLFLQRLAAPEGAYISSCPAHVAKQYHPNFADKAKLDEMVKAGSFKAWTELFVNKMGNHCQSFWSTDARPTTYAWINEKAAGPNSTQVTFVRNPYYWKVDGEGNQYPYIDKITVDVLQDVAAMLLKVTNGEVDFQARTFNTDANKPVVFDNQKKGDYKLVPLTKGDSNTVAIHFNLTSKDPVKRAVFSLKDFRVAMSYAINRQEVIDTVFISQGKPAQPAPLEGTAYYNKQLATQYIEYDVKKANELLDKLGMKKGADGFRMTPEGKPFAFIIEGTGDLTKYIVDVGPMLVKYWKAVGINVEFKAEARDLFYTRKDGNETDCTLWGGAGGFNPILDARNYAPVNYESNWAVAWKDWYNNNKDPKGEEPPADAKALVTKFDEARTAGSYADQVKKINELMQLTADFFPNIGISTASDGYAIAKNNLKNVPDRMVTDFTYSDPFIARTFAWYFGK